MELGTKLKVFINNNARKAIKTGLGFKIPIGEPQLTDVVTDDGETIQESIQPFVFLYKDKVTFGRGRVAIELYQVQQLWNVVDNLYRAKSKLRKAENRSKKIAVRSAMLDDLLAA